MSSELSELRGWKCEILALLSFLSLSRLVPPCLVLSRLRAKMLTSENATSCLLWPCLVVAPPGNTTPSRAKQIEEKEKKEGGTNIDRAIKPRRLPRIDGGGGELTHLSSRKTNYAKKNRQTRTIIRNLLKIDFSDHGGGARRDTKFPPTATPT